MKTSYVYLEQVDMYDAEKCFTQNQEIEITGYIHALINRPWVTLQCSCGHDFHQWDDSITVEMYSHEGGWKICSNAPKQWLFISCDKCGHQTSFDKLGIGR